MLTANITARKEPDRKGFGPMPHLERQTLIDIERNINAYLESPAFAAEALLKPGVDPCGRDWFSLNTEAALPKIRGIVDSYLVLELPGTPCPFHLALKDTERTEVLLYGPKNGSRQVIGRLCSENRPEGGWHNRWHIRFYRQYAYRNENGKEIPLTLEETAKRIATEKQKGKNHD